MKFHTPNELEKGIEINSDRWHLFIEYECTPYEAFDKVPFLTNAQAGKLSEYSTCICSFGDEELAQEAINQIKERYEEEQSDIKANLIHNGILIDSI